jgi:ribosome-binding factor A
MTHAVAGMGQRRGYRRHVRVGEALREVVAEAIERRLDDPRLGFVTVTAVDAAPDLRSAKVFVSVLEENSEGTLAALADAAPLLQREIARHLRLMWTPRLAFIPDTGQERAFRLDALIDQAVQDTRNDIDIDTEPPAEGEDTK